MLGLLVTALLAQPAGDGPRPLVELTFDQGLVDSGELGATIEQADYAPGEGPAYLPGPWGDCLDLTAASRFGGTLEQKDPAGGAVLLADPRIDSLVGFTVTLWAAPAGGNEAINSRLLNKMGSWELAYSRGGYAVLIAHGESKSVSGFRSPAGASDWTFVALTIEPADGRLRCRMGTRLGLGEPQERELAQPPDRSPGRLEIGTYAGIRPYRGKLDNLRLYDRPLTAEEVAAVYHRDLDSFASTTIYETAMPSLPARRFDPQHADIFFSSRWQSRRKEEAFRLYRDYHVSHLLWVYGNSPDYIREVHDLGIWYQGTLNGLCGYQESTPEPSGEGDVTGRQQDFDGHKVILSHMRKWSPKRPLYTGDHNSPAFRALFFAAVDQLVAAGIDGLHIDDWEMGLATAAVGMSGFSPDSLAGFRTYVQENLTAAEREALGIDDLAAFDYRAYLTEHEGIRSQDEYRKKYRDLPLTPHLIEYQRRGLRDFYAALRKHLDTISPDKYIPVSVNNQFYRRGRDGGLRGVFALDRLDFFVGEASRGMQSAGDYILPCRTAAGLGIPQVMMSKPRVLGHAQAALATAYALGQWMRVPWDLYMDNAENGQPAPRYYGADQDWQPFYDFVYGHADLFNGYVEAATVGILFNADEPCYAALNEICERLAAAQVPYALIGAAAKHSRVPLQADRLEAVRYLVTLSPLESFSEEDQQTIAAVQAKRTVRFLPPGGELVDVLRAAGRLPIRVEGPPGVYAFLRVRSEGDPAAVVHLVNWDALPADIEPPAGVGAAVYANVTLTLTDPAAWGEVSTVNYYQPGDNQPTEIRPEVHRDMIRITLPRLATWGIVEIRAGTPE